MSVSVSTPSSGAIALDAGKRDTQEANQGSVEAKSGPLVIESSAPHQPVSDVSNDTMHALPTPPDPLSKNSQKKLLKKERLAVQKAEKKQAKKDARKRAREEQAKKDPGEQSTTDVKDDAEVPAPKRRRVVSKFKATVVIDLAFDNMMLEKEISSLCNQLAYVYASNRRAEVPFTQIVCTRLDGQTEAKLQGTSNGAHMRWKDVHWFNKGYEDIWVEDSTQQEASPSSNLALPLLKEKMVYLTADSTEVLSELKEDEVYILGGICDHNRYKNLCQDKATKQGIRTAALPIGKYMAEMQTRRVLTVNQVFDIMCAWNVHRDWSVAFQTVIPKRKLKTNAGSADREPS